MSNIPQVHVTSAPTETINLNPPFDVETMKRELGGAAEMPPPQSLASALAGEQPQIQPPPATSVELPGGLYRDGQLIRTAQIRELTGYDEEALGSLDIERDGVDQYITLLLQRACVQVGHIRVSEEPDIVWDMLVGDREYLVLAIRQATFGNDLPLTISDNRPDCGESFDMVVELDRDIPVTRAPEHSPFSPLITYHYRNHEIVYQVPTGRHRENLKRIPSSNMAKVNTALLGEIVQSMDGKAVTIEDIRKMPVGLRRGILLDITEHSYGPRFDTIQVTCPKCRKELGVSLTLSNLF